ncbi:hypothetical protein AX774_g6164 [Zancudomyces culisetae]|uniref:Uncharacterized protein n=1 Tax=Zancudomyces culisetae TaxID=1213189 RepID=A0A1R1PHH7_ZANCU|nr:hypothetical protein AX774_g6164 [Zancudomyces culisetae]|eukprot:OMH80398.1 hypothetical protein AX774_g6164 [Zancudomyces culisetae]
MDNQDSIATEELGHPLFAQRIITIQSVEGVAQVLTANGVIDYNYKLVGDEGSVLGYIRSKIEKIYLSANRSSDTSIHYYFYDAAGNWLFEAIKDLLYIDFSLTVRSASPYATIGYIEPSSSRYGVTKLLLHNRTCFAEARKPMSENLTGVFDHCGNLLAKFVRNVARSQLQVRIYDFVSNVDQDILYDILGTNISDFNKRATILALAFDSYWNFFLN